MPSPHALLLILSALWTPSRALLALSPLPALHLVYINLPARLDRRAAIEAQLASVGWPSSHIHRLAATPHSDGLLGCTLSHAAALELAVQANWTSELAVVVMEDDAVFRSPRAAQLQLSLFSGWAAAGGAWDVVLLSGLRREVVVEGAVPGASGPAPTALSLRAAQRYQTTAAYMIRGGYLPTLAAAARAAASRMAAEGPARHAYHSFDQSWKALQEGDAWLHFSPMLMDQAPGLSDITGHHADYVRDYGSFEAARAALEGGGGSAGVGPFQVEWESNAYYGVPRQGLDAPAGGADTPSGSYYGMPRQGLDAPAGATPSSSTPHVPPSVAVSRQPPSSHPLPPPARPLDPRPPPRHVVIELGSNIGDWMEPYLRDHPGAVPIMVEALPRFAPRLQALAAAHGGAFFAAAAWSHSGENVTFHEADDGGDSVASSLFEDHVAGCAAAQGGPSRPSRTHTVPTLDILELLDAHTAQGDHIVLRMDVEGAEYTILRRLILSGRACSLAVLHVEAHSQYSAGLARFYLLELQLGWLLEGCRAAAHGSLSNQRAGGPQLVLTQQRGALPAFGTISQHVPGCRECAWTQETAWYSDISA